MSAAPMTLEKMAAETRFDLQLELVKEHWASVRHLWLEKPALNGAGKLRSDLPDEFWLACGMPGLAATKPTCDGLFEFAEGGHPAIIIPAYDTDPWLLDANAERHVEHLVDLVAADVDHPDRFWLRRGEALILGNAYLEIAGQENEPLPVFRNPITWLRSGGEGVVVLDWDWAWDLLLGLDLIAEDVELGERLEAALKPEIWVMEAAA